MLVSDIMLRVEQGSKTAYVNRLSEIRSRHSEHSGIRRFFDCAVQIKKQKSWAIVALDNTAKYCKSMTFDGSLLCTGKKVLFLIFLKRATRL